jgi:hypothetical protein
LKPTAKFITPLTRWKLEYDLLIILALFGKIACQC